MVYQEIVVLCGSPAEHWAVVAGFEAFFQVESVKIPNGHNRNEIIMRSFGVRRGDVLLDIKCAISLEVDKTVQSSIVKNADLIIYIGDVRGNPTTCHIGDIVFANSFQPIEMIGINGTGKEYFIPDDVQAAVHKTLMNEINFVDYYSKTTGELQNICQKCKWDPIVFEVPKSVELETVGTVFIPTDEEANRVYEMDIHYMDSDLMRSFMHACEIRNKPLGKKNHVVICHVARLGRKLPNNPVLMNGALMASIAAGHFMLEFFNCK